MNIFFKGILSICAMLVFIGEGQVVFFFTKHNPLDAGGFTTILLACTFGGMIIGKFLGKIFSKEM